MMKTRRRIKTARIRQKHQCKTRRRRRRRRRRRPPPPPFRKVVVVAFGRDIIDTTIIVVVTIIDEKKNEQEEEAASDGARRERTKAGDAFEHFYYGWTKTTNGEHGRIDASGNEIGIGESVQISSVGSLREKPSPVRRWRRTGDERRTTETTERRIERDADFVLLRRRRRDDSDDERRRRLCVFAGVVDVGEF